MQADIDRVTEALSMLRSNPSHALATLQETLQRRPVLVSRVFPYLPELSKDENVRTRLWVLSFLDDLVKVDRHGKQALMHVKQAMAVWSGLVRDRNNRVAKKALESVSSVLPLALKVCLLDPEAHSLRAGLVEMESSVVSILGQQQGLSVPLASQALRLVEALVLCFLPAPAASRSAVFDASEVPDGHVLLKRAALLESAETFVVFLVSHLRSVPAMVAASVVSVLASVACQRPQMSGHVLPALLALDPLDPVPNTSSAVARKSVRKSLQLALLRVLRQGEASSSSSSSNSNSWAADLEASVLGTGGQKQLEKLQRGNKRGRDEYDWDLDGPGAGGAVDEPQMISQTLPQLQQQQQQYLPVAAAAYVPADLVLLDWSVLGEVEELIKEMSVEQMADIVIENMLLFSAVGSRPGDEGFFEMAAARDPRRTEERRLRQKAPRMALAGVTSDGLRVPCYDEEGFRRQWRQCVARIVAAEESMKDKGQRGVLMRAAVLARLLAGKALDDETCRGVLLHVTSDLSSRSALALQWLNEEFRVEQFVERDQSDVKIEKMDLSKDGEEENDDAEDDEGGPKTKRQALDPSLRYHFLFMNILEGCLPTVDLLHDVLSSLLLDAPWLPRACLVLLDSLSGDPQRHASGLALLAALAKSRPRYRAPVLQALLQHAVAERPQVREKAISHAAELALLVECQDLIFSFAQQSFAEAAFSAALNVVCEPAAFLDTAPLASAPAALSEEKAREYAEQQEQLRKLVAEKSASDARHVQSAGVTQLCSLLFVLAGHKLELLLPVANTYQHLGPVFRQEVQGLLRVCLEHAVGLSDHKEPPALAAVLAAFPPQAAELAQLALQHIAEPSEDLVKVCRSRREKEDDVRYLLPVLRALKPREVLQDAPRFLAQPKAVLLEFVNRAMATSFFAEKPSELLLRFHTSTAQETRCADENELLLRQSAAIGVAILHPKCTQETVLSLLRRLAEGKPIHSLFMKTTMQAVVKFPKILEYVLKSLLPKVIQGLPWKNAVLWRGFVKFCVEALDKGSAAVLVQLPVEVLSKLMSEETAVLSHLQRFVRDTKNRGIPQPVKRLISGKK